MEGTWDNARSAQGEQARAPRRLVPIARGEEERRHVTQIVSTRSNRGWLAVGLRSAVEDEKLIAKYVGDPTLRTQLRRWQQAHVSCVRSPLPASIRTDHPHPCRSPNQSLPVRSCAPRHPSASGPPLPSQPYPSFSAGAEAVLSVSSQHFVESPQAHGDHECSLPCPAPSSA